MVYVHPHALYLPLTNTGGATDVADLSGRIRHTVNTFETPRVTGNVPLSSAARTVRAGATCCNTVWKVTVLTSAMAVTTAVERTSWISTTTWRTFRTTTFARSAIATSTALTTSIRYVELPDKRLRADCFQHNLAHRSLDYECLKCDRGFKTYGGMVCASSSWVIQPVVDTSRSSISNQAAAATLTATLSTLWQRSATGLMSSF